MRLSYWEKDTFFKNIDVAIIGSGIVGLNAAWHLKILNPTLHVVILERSFLPYGASTRNAGFACFGSISELLDDLTRESEQEVFTRVEKRYLGLLKLRQKLGDENILYQGYGGYEVFTRNDEKLFNVCTNSINFFNDSLLKITGEKNTYTVCDDKIPAMGFKNITHIINNRLEGQIDTGKMMQALIAKARDAGVVILNGINIERIENNSNNVSLTEISGFSFEAKKLLVCNNGFAKQLLPNADVTPARAQVLVTSPIADLRFKGCFHYDKGYYYFRNVGNRILFGGGRNLDFKGETTYEMNLTTQIQDKLKELLTTTIAPDLNYTIEQSWSGIMGLGNSKTTIVKKLNSNVYCAVRMGGMGVAIGTLVGEEAALMVINDV